MVTGEPWTDAVIVVIGLGGILAGPLSLVFLIGAVWGARWSLRAIGSVLLFWGAFTWATGVAQFVAIDSLEEAETTLRDALLGAGALVLMCAACVGWRSGRRRQRG